MGSKSKKDNIFEKVGELFNQNPIASGTILSVVLAVFMASLIINRDIIASNMRFLAFISFVIPGAVIFIFIGFYIGILMNRKQAKQAMKGDSEIGLKLGAVAFYHSWMQDKTTNQKFQAVKGPCCTVCGEDFWEADRLEKNDRLVFECQKCRNTSSVKLRDHDQVKGETEVTFQRAYERLKKYRDRFGGAERTAPVFKEGNE